MEETEIVSPADLLSLGRLVKFFGHGIGAMHM